MFKLGNKEFKTKEEAKKQVSILLNSYKNNEILSDDDFKIVYDVLKMHPRFNEKVGNGVKYIFVKFEEFRRKNCFWIKRVDSSETDFGFYKCFSSKTRSSKETYVLEAARTTISIQISNFRRENNIFDEPVDVHHKRPLTFKQILYDFLSLKNLNINDVEVDGLDDGGVYRSFKDKTLEKEFFEYHKKVAIMEVVPRKDHGKIEKEEKLLDFNF